jgi:hypothetical protein
MGGERRQEVGPVQSGAARSLEQADPQSGREQR